MSKPNIVAWLDDYDGEAPATRETRFVQICADIRVGSMWRDIHKADHAVDVTFAKNSAIRFRDIREDGGTSPFVVEMDPRMFTRYFEWVGHEWSHPRLEAERRKEWDSMVAVGGLSRPRRAH